MTYDPFTGSLLSATADSANLKATTRYTYDAAGLPLTAADPMGIVTSSSPRARRSCPAARSSRQPSRSGNSRPPERY